MIEFKLTDFFYPKDLAHTVLLLWRSEHWSSAQFDVYQAHHLARLIKHCSNEVSYYGPLFQQVGLDPNSLTPKNFLRELSRIPVLDKDTLRVHPESFLARNAGVYKPKSIQTSGTTGTPLTVYWDRGSNIFEVCSIQRLWRWCGFWPGQPFLDLRSRPINGDESHLVRDDEILYIHNRKVNGLEFSSDFINQSNIHKYYNLLLNINPRLIRGHPQAIEYLANLLETNGLKGWKPFAITTASEALHSHQRKQIEQAWGVPIIDSYGLKEHNVFIAQCLEGSYHIFSEYGICEILDDNWNPVKPGEEGWIVATGLHNYAQPLLRYNTRDRAIAGNERPCRCGRTLPTVERIIGRIDDCIYTRDGRRYSGMSFAFFGFDSIRQARLIQEDFEHVTVEMVLIKDLNQEECRALVDLLERKVENKIRFDLKPVSEIVQQTPGKYKFVVSLL